MNDAIEKLSRSVMLHNYTVGVIVNKQMDCKNLGRRFDVCVEHYLFLDGIKNN